MKKWTSLICIAALLIALLPGYSLPATAAETSGICGDNLTWEMSNRTLTISGTGPMYDYASDTEVPWYPIRYDFSKLVLPDGITYIGDYALSYTAFRIHMPKSVTAIGSKAFYGLSSPELYFYGEAPIFAEDMLAGTSNKTTIATILDWPEELKQNYGGNVVWEKMDLRLETQDCKQLYHLDEVLQPEDFVFRAHFPAINTKIDYVPKNVSFSEYDNSTYGEKRVTVNADGYIYDFTYYVTDGSNHLDLINVEFPDLPVYDNGYISNYEEMQPVVTMGSQLAKLNTHYTLERHAEPDIGFGYMTITGIGICEGFSKIFYYPILKADLSKHKLLVTNFMNAEYNGMPFVPETTVRIPNHTHQLEEGSDYEIVSENNTNPGRATIWLVGTNNVYGCKEYSFDIVRDDQYVHLPGKYIGHAYEELSDDIAIEQEIIPPCKVSAYISTSGPYVVAYALYRVDGGDFTLILEDTKNSWEEDTDLVYDFSYIYEGAMDKGGEVFALSYSWVDSLQQVFAGITYLIIPAKVPDATSMTMYKVENDGDFRNDYFGVTGDDGALGDITWTSSDTSVASVENGIVALNKPGTATITAQYGDLTQSQTMTVDLLDLTQGVIFDYSEETGARVIWDSRILEEGTDYTLSVEKNGDAVTVTATGCGLFTGELMKEFVDLDSLADPHTHGFDSSCDGTCNGCDFTRDRDHTFSIEWSKDQENHYHECTVCGEKKDVAEHTLTGNGKECTVCGKLWIPGDIDGNGTVNREDVIALLLHVSMPTAFPISIPADYTGDGQVTRDDVIQLLLHVSMPDAFPLQ